MDISSLFENVCAFNERMKKLGENLIVNADVLSQGFYC